MDISFRAELQASPSVSHCRVMHISFIFLVMVTVDRGDEVNSPTWRGLIPG